MAAALVMLVACRGTPKAAPPGATVGTAPAQTTTTNPFAVPAAIDAAYVNRVLGGLDAAVGEVVRMVVASKTIPREASDRLRALYANDPLLQLKIDGFQADIRRDLAGYRLPIPGNKKTEVVELISASKSCIFSKVHRDFTAVSSSTRPELSTQWVAIRPLDVVRDPFGYNTLGWAFAYDGFEPGVLPPGSNPCSVA